MNSFRFVASSLEDTDRLGAALAELVPDCTTIALHGTLGAGKTRLVQAVAANCGIARSDVVSPTFILCQEYHGTRTIYHFDAYRLRGDEEFQALGPDECFRAAALVFVEWAERVPNTLPVDRFEVQIDVETNDRRTFLIIARSRRLEPILQALQKKLQ